MTYMCLDCGLDFYMGEPTEGVTEEIADDDYLIDDEEALRTAEEATRGFSKPVPGPYSH